MSETIFEGQDDEEPPSPSSIYRENHQTGEVYDGRLSEYYEALQPIQHLCRAADTIIEQYMSAEAKAEREMYQQYDIKEFSDEVRHGEVLLRRVNGLLCHDYDCNVEVPAYFLINEATGYCRSWTNHDPQVSWCFDEQRHEPPAEVAEKLQTAFPQMEGLATKKRLNLRGVLRKFL